MQEAYLAPTIRKTANVTEPRSYWSILRARIELIKHPRRTFFYGLKLTRSTVGDAQSLP
jgi:hypothetical protein